MAKVNTLLTDRLKSSDPSSKMSVLAKSSSLGSLSSFAGLFQVQELPPHAATLLRELLLHHCPTPDQEIESDLRELTTITCEVRAISNQAALLHGERIKRAQTLLKAYRDGAFTAWLIAAYGNRQTPYNLLQYYEFHEAIPLQLKPKLNEMPRQAVYSLASRQGEPELKYAIVDNHHSKTKSELLTLIREVFPLNKRDKRKQNPRIPIASALNHALSLLQTHNKKLSKADRAELGLIIEKLLETLQGR